MGHVRNYTMGDVVARYKRAKGFNVLHPMGWDAFGMPAENAAIERKVHPKDVDLRQHRTMRAQLKPMGLSLDWSREFATCDPAYYRHQQRAVPRLPQEAGLVYRKHRQGQLGPGGPYRAGQRAGDRRPRLALGRAGRAARADAVVLQDHRLRRRAADALDGLERWPEKVRLMQKNWIGAPKASSPLRTSTPPTVGIRRSRSSPPGPTRCSAQASWRCRRPSARRVAAKTDGEARRVHRGMPQASAPARRRSTRPRRRASTPVVRRAPARPDDWRCRSMSRISS